MLSIEAGSFHATRTPTNDPIVNLAWEMINAGNPEVETYGIELLELWSKYDSGCPWPRESPHLWP
jgi:peptide methionine sulfoxide reductase MsrB